MNFFVDVLANIIIQQYFANCRCLLVFTDQANRFLFSGDLPIVNVRVSNSSDFIHPEIFLRYHGCQGFIVKSNKPTKVFSEIEREIKLTTERFNQRKYLFLPGDDMSENVKNIFQMQELRYIADLLIVDSEKEKIDSKTMSMEDEIMSLWTHKYVGIENTAEEMNIDFWFSKNQSFKFFNDLYPNKLVNQMERVILMATFQYEPYSILGSRENEHKGSEMMTALMFAKQYNMTPQLVVNEEGYWGDIFDNWTGYGLLGNLVGDKADIGFSALYTWEAEYHFLDLSKPMVRTGITCLVPAPELAAGWLSPLYSYSMAMWAAVGSMFFICIFVQFAMFYFQMKLYNRNKNYIELLNQSVFCIVKLFVQQVITEKERSDGKSGKYFMGLLFTFSLFLSSSYSSGLATIMTIPRYRDPINTPEEFVNSGIFWGATHHGWVVSIQYAEDIMRLTIFQGDRYLFWILFILQSESLKEKNIIYHIVRNVPFYKTIVSRFVATNEEELRAFSKTYDFAFPLERLPNNYAIGSYIQKDVIGNYHLMREDFYWEECVMMARKSSVLLPLLDLFILRVFETGLISYWQNEATSLFMDSHVQEAVKFYYYNHQNRNFIVKLKWVHVEGAFGLLCIGYVTSLFVLSLENILHRMY